MRTSSQAESYRLCLRGADYLSVHLTLHLGLSWAPDRTVLLPLAHDGCTSIFHSLVMTGITDRQAVVAELTARDWKAWMAGRILSGASQGFLGSSVMVYLSEIAVTQIRGALLGAFALCFALGQFFIAVGLQIIFVASNSLIAEFLPADRTRTLRCFTGTHCTRSRLFQQGGSDLDLSFLGYSLPSYFIYPNPQVRANHRSLTDRKHGCAESANTAKRNEL